MSKSQESAALINKVGEVNGIAELDGSGKVPSSQLPSFVDDVLEYADFASLPGTGETGKIYVTLDDGKTYRWSGSSYVEISESLALGETSTTAYRGDRGKTAYDHSQLTSGNPHSVTKSEVGLGNVPDLDTTAAVNKAHDQNTDTKLDEGQANEVTASELRSHVDSTADPHDTKNENWQERTAGWTLAVADSYRIDRCTSASDVNATVPPNSSEAFPVGYWRIIRQTDTGLVTVVEGSGVTVNGDKKTVGQNTGLMLIKVGTNEWDCYGGGS